MNPLLSTGSWGQKFVLAMSALLLALFASNAYAQLGRTIPDQNYYQSIEEIYRAEYQRATRGLQNEIRGSVKFSIQDRWVDSICFHTMLGEALYQQGLYADALQQLDRALELFASQATWLNRINFQQPPRPDLNRGRRLPAWARSNRQVSYADVPASFLVAIGRLDNSATAQQGGVVQTAQYWNLDAQEVARSVAWALYRRGSILGPLTGYDRLQNRIADRIARGGLGPTPHWSNAWIELWWGISAASTSGRAKAEPHLMKATLIDGLHDHPMTGLALLIRGRLAREAGDPNAGALLNDAIVAALAYEDYPTLNEALYEAHLYQTTHSPSVMHPMLAPLSQAAAREGLAHIAIRSALAQSDALLFMGQVDQARDRMQGIFRREREAERGLLGIEATRLRAIGLAHQDAPEPARQAAVQAITAMRATSLRNFQIGLANTWYDNGMLSPRLAPEVYQRLLGAPSKGDWLELPLDVLASLATDHSGALERWFMAEVGKNNALGAIQASDLAKRRKFISTQPLAGRAAGLRRLLESHEAVRSIEERQLRTTLLDIWPRYRVAYESGTAVRSELLALDNLFAAENIQQRKRLTTKLEKSITTRESLLVAMALSRMPSLLSYPAPLAIDKAKSQLSEGEALVIFHQAANEYYGMLLVGEGEDLWNVGSAGKINQQTAELLRLVAGVSPQQKWSVEQLSEESWRTAAEGLSQSLFSQSRLDFARVKRLRIVPNRALWHLPFEILPTVGSNQSKESLIDLAPVSYSPTAGQALAARRPESPVKHIAWIKPTGDESDRPSPLAQVLSKAHRAGTKGSMNPLALKGVSQQMVFSMPGSISLAEPLGLPLGVERTSPRLGDWLRLPHRGPEAILFDQVTTSAERALKSSRRSSKDESAINRLGDELFLATCAALAPGSRSVLFARWQTGGRHHDELVAEYLTGLSQMPATEAWRRSVQLSRPMKLSFVREPRLESPSDEGATPPPVGEHPFFWSGFMLVE